MALKKITSLLLSLFLIITVTVMINKIMTDSGSSVSDTHNDLTGDIDIIYFFYTNYRCETCKLIEKYTFETITARFSDKLDNGKLIWKTVNTDEKQHEHFIEEYKIYTKSVVLSKIKDGREISWKNLRRVWDLVEDETAFKEYIEQKVQDFLLAN